MRVISKFETLVDKLFVLFATTLLLTHLYILEFFITCQLKFYLILFISNHVISHQNFTHFVVTEDTTRQEIKHNSPKFSKKSGKVQQCCYGGHGGAMNPSKLWGVVTFSLP